jgi:hypothetical protein
MGMKILAQLVRSERPSRRFPICSPVKAGEPRRGLAWGGELESLHVGNLWPRQERGDLRVRPRFRGRELDLA